MAATAMRWAVCRDRVGVGDESCKNGLLGGTSYSFVQALLL